MLTIIRSIKGSNAKIACDNCQVVDEVDDAKGLWFCPECGVGYCLDDDRYITRECMDCKKHVLPEVNWIAHKVA